MTLVWFSITLFLQLLFFTFEQFADLSKLLLLYVDCPQRWCFVVRVFSPPLISTCVGRGGNTSFKWRMKPKRRSLPSEVAALVLERSTKPVSQVFGLLQVQARLHHWLRHEQAYFRFCQRKYKLEALVFMVMNNSITVFLMEACGC